MTLAAPGLRQGLSLSVGGRHRLRRSGSEGQVNLKLKLALLALAEPQYLVAQRADMSETRLSRIVNGRVQPSANEQTRLVEILGVSLDELFPPESGSRQ